MEEIKIMLFEYLDIFLKGLNDIGCIDLVIYEINMGLVVFEK